MSEKTYSYPVGVDGSYEAEPTDEQCAILVRALWHYATAYEPRGIRTTTVEEIINDLVTASAGGGLGMTRDEWVAISSGTGVPV